MPLSDKLVNKLRDIFKDQVGVELDFDTTREYVESYADAFYTLAEIDRKKSG